MKTWILTGGIACGKSSATQFMLRSLPDCVAYFSADECVRQFQQEKEFIVRLNSFMADLGKKELFSGGILNRQLLRELVFTDDEVKKGVEAIVHPHVWKCYMKESTAARQNGMELFLAEVPLYYEIGTTVSADLVIVVASSRLVQVQRLMDRRGLEESIIDKMLRAQWSVEAKAARADVVIWNDGGLSAFEDQLFTLVRQHRHA